MDVVIAVWEVENWAGKRRRGFEEGGVKLIDAWYGESWGRR